MFSFERLKVLFKNNNVLVRNFSALTILQISQYVFPLITFPYLVRVLEPKGYGLVAFITAFIGYFKIITDYGFNLSATKEISRNRKNKEKLSEIFSSVITVKIILFVLSFFLLLPVVSVIPKFNQNSNLYFIAFISVVGSVLFPIWFFQGLERMSFITIINLIVKTLWVISIFIFVIVKEDLYLVLLLESLSSITIGIIGIMSVKYYWKINLTFVGFKKIKKQFKESWYYFLSTISISFYTISNVFILGLFVNYQIVGFFSAADKIRVAIQNITAISGQTIFPHLSLKFKESKELALHFIKKYLKIFGIISFVLSLILFFFAKEIIYLVLGSSYGKSVILLKILSFLPFIIFLSNIAGVQIMLNLDYKKEFTKIIFAAGIINIFLSFLFVPIFFEYATASVVVFTEIIVTLSMIKFLQKKKITLA